MSLINPFKPQSSGNPRERLNAIEIEIAQLKGILNLLLARFEHDRGFFAEVTKVANPGAADTPNTGKDQEHHGQDKPKASPPQASK